MARSDRIAITVSPSMSIALDVLGARSGLSRSAQAQVILRQGLARTIETRTVQERLRERKAQWTAKQWQEDTMTEHAVEQAYAAFDEGAQLDEVEEANEAAHGRAGSARSETARDRRLGPPNAVADARLPHSEGASS